MEALRNVVVFVFVVSFFYAGGWEIFRGFFVGRRFKEYAGGLKTNFAAPEELMQVIRNMNCFLVKQVYYNEQGNVGAGKIREASVESREWCDSGDSQQRRFKKKLQLYS